MTFLLLLVAEGFLGSSRPSKRCSSSPSGHNGLSDTAGKGVSVGDRPTLVSEPPSDGGGSNLAEGDRDMRGDWSAAEGDRGVRRDSIAAEGDRDIRGDGSLDEGLGGRAPRAAAGRPPLASSTFFLEDEGSTDAVRLSVPPKTKSSSSTGLGLLRTSKTSFAICDPAVFSTSMLGRAREAMALN
jgi:hypothetical protein